MPLVMPNASGQPARPSSLYCPTWKWTWISAALVVFRVLGLPQTTTAAQTTTPLPDNSMRLLALCLSFKKRRNPWIRAHAEQSAGGLGQERAVKRANRRSGDVVSLNCAEPDWNVFFCLVGLLFFLSLCRLLLLSSAMAFSAVCRLVLGMGQKPSLVGSIHICWPGAPQLLLRPLEGNCSAHQAPLRSTTQYGRTCTYEVLCTSMIPTTTVGSYLSTSVTSLAFLDVLTSFCTPLAFGPH